MTFMRYAHHFAARFVRPMTLGVRTVVLDDQNRVLLVRHSYIPGWHLPGGGVDAGEHMAEAAKRELLEETAVTTTGELSLHGIFYNNRYSRRDHVAVYIVREFDASKEKQADWEIVETGFFPIDDLPDETARATRDRIAEIVTGSDQSHIW